MPALESLRLNGNATVGCVPRELEDLLLVGALLSDDPIEQQVLNDIPLVGVLPSIVENAGRRYRQYRRVNRRIKSGRGP